MVRLTPKTLLRLDQFRMGLKVDAFEEDTSRSRTVELLILRGLPPWQEPQRPLPIGLCQDDRSWTDGRGFHCTKDQGHPGDCAQEEYGDDFRPPPGYVKPKDRR